jgi:hypothetical protein
MRIREVLFAMAVASGVGCIDRPLAAVYPVQVKVETKELPSNPQRDVDILFLIDSSGSMEAEQASLRANFPKFMDVLQTIEGGLPNVHIGVTTPDLGQKAGDGFGALPSGSGCELSGDDGALRMAPSITGKYIIDEESGPTRNRNYTGTLGDAFASIATVGTGGCGIEQHLGAVERALTNPTNAGFLRPEAKLAVIVIADEDDCSVARKSLFEAGLDGTAINFRCTQSGVVCRDTPDLTIPGVRTSCEVQPQSQYLESVERYVSFVKGLKAKPEDVIVAGILGNNSPFEIKRNDRGQPFLDTSCEYGTNDGAYPALRTSDFVGAFQHSVRKSICGGDLSEAMVDIGALLKRSFGDPCWEGEVADLDPETEGLQAECTVTDVRIFPDGSRQEIDLIPSCSFGVIPCWRLETDLAKCGYTDTTQHLKLVVDRGGVIPPADISVTASCLTVAPDEGPFM